MKFKIEIDLENDAFQGGYETENEEISRILEEISYYVKRNTYTVNVPHFERDLNGNKVGFSIFTNK
jgi:hypothetical protein